MRRNYFKFWVPALFAAFTLFAIPSCDLTEEEEEALLENLGWIGTGEDGENLEAIEDDISFANGEIPSSVDLSDQFPPIGNQGSYGTCVAWAVGYNHKSFLEAKDQGYTTSDMTSTSKQFSPKYLFWSIPTEQKGEDCNGTGFEAAFDILQSKGIPTMAKVPYTDLGDCTGSASSWDGDASGYKIDAYRQIDHTSAEEIKRYLAEGRAVTIGAKLGDNFMSWASTGVLKTETYGYSGQHAYHAMILSGYDDSKGAFRVVNSWGEDWGDNGGIWVDETFFTSEFCFCAFVASNIKGNPDEDGDNVVDDPTTGKDLMAWELADEPNPDGSSELARQAVYNVFNSGTEVISASEDWNILYVYYNAYNGNDWSIILYDYYSDDYGSYGEDGEMTSGGVGVMNWWNHIDVPARQSAAQALYGQDDSRFRFSYTMPEITGDYYLVIIADGYDVINEVDEDNNYFFLTDANGEPIEFVDGVMQEATAKKLVNTKKNPTIGENSVSQTARTAANLNAYSPKEIQTMIENHKKSGLIQQRAAMYKRTNGTSTKTRVSK